MALPVTVEFHKTETPLSLASRLAHANGYRSMRGFLATTDTNATAITSGDPEAMALLAHWSGVEEARLAAYAIASVTAGATWKLGHALMGRDMRPGRNHRYCPKCVVDDLENGSGRPSSRPYVRAAWMTRALQNCPKHACAVKEAPVSAQEQGDFVSFVAKNVSTIRAEAIDASAASSSQVDRYVVARIEGIPANEFLANFETYVAVDLCRHFGCFQKMHRIAYDRCDLASNSDVECGFGSASAGRDLIERIICQAIEQSKPMVYEMASFFGPLRDWLLRNHKKPEFSLVTEIFQDIAERNLPIGPDEAFVLRTRKRHLHSIRSAGLEYGMMEDRIHDLLLEANLIAPSQLTSAQIYFDASRGHAVLADALDTMTSAEIRTALGIRDDRMRAILDAGLLRRVEQPKDGARVFSRVQRSEFEAFKKALFGRSLNGSSTDGLLRLDKAAQRCGCQTETILKFGLEGSLKSLHFEGGRTTLSNLLVDWEEVRACLNHSIPEVASLNGNVQNDSHRHLNVRDTERRIGTARATISELLRLGYLNTETRINPATRREQQYILAASVDAFIAEHICLALLSDRAGVFPGILRQKLEAEGVRPIYEPTGRNSRFYRRPDVAHWQ